jgi:glycogen operon protein
MFALPSIGNCEWKAVLGTDDNNVIVDDELNSDYIDIKPRSISILVGKQLQPKAEPVVRKRKAAGTNAKSRKPRKSIKKDN